MNREEVIEYLAGLEPRERFILDREVSALRSKLAEKAYENNRKKYKQKLQRDKERGEEMMKKVKPGMVVKCEGTKDGLGIREVMEVNDSGITARKIRMEWREYYRDGYITSHGWDKVKKILNIEIDD